jgi:hypothetical protein
MEPQDEEASSSSDPLNFDHIFRATYPNRGKLGPSRKRKAKGAVVYECLLCSWSNPKRDNAVYHAKRKHNDAMDSYRNMLIERSSDLGPPSKQARLDDFYNSTPPSSALRRVFNPQRYTESMVAILTRRRLPFSAVTWDEMQDIMLACNPAIEDLIMVSRHEAMRHIAANFNLYQSQLMAKLQSAASKVHISSDLWTSPHRHGVLAICARWVDQDYQPRRALLGLQEIRHSHSGEHQSRLLFSTLELYGVTKQLGCHTGDNATSNDTCLQHLSTRMKRDLQVRLVFNATCASPSCLFV